MSIPNYLTLLRILLIPVLVIVFYLPFYLSHLLCALVFAIAALTDWFDGYLARTWQQTSKFGAFLDPVADKLIIAVALVLIVSETHIPYLAVPAAVIIGREIAISALREWMAELGRRTSVTVSKVAKIKTSIQMLAVLLLLAAQPAWPLFSAIGAVLLYLAAILTLWSMLMYMWASKKAAYNEHKHR